MRQVISLCVWGNSKIYNYGIYENAIRLPKFFPGWILAVYHTKTADLEVMRELSKMPNVEVYEVDFPDHYRNSMLRYLAGFDIRNDIAIFRDADSRFNKRDADAVKDWIDSGKDVHVMRDHPNNGKKYRISAGMWGVRNNFLIKNNLSEKFANFFSNSNNKTWGIDEKFLFLYVYPLINSNNSRIHSDFRKWESWATGFPKNADSRNRGFIGMSITWTPNASKKFNNPLLSHKKKRIHNSNNNIKNLKII